MTRGSGGGNKEGKRRDKIAAAIVYDKVVYCYRELAAEGVALGEDRPFTAMLLRRYKERYGETLTNTHVWALWRHGGHPKPPIKEILKKDLQEIGLRLEAERLETRERAERSIRILLNNRLQTLAMSEQQTLQIMMGIFVGRNAEVNGVQRRVPGLYAVAQALMEAAIPVLTNYAKGALTIRDMGQIIQYLKEILALGRAVQQQIHESAALERAVLRNGAQVLHDLGLRSADDEGEEEAGDEELDALYNALQRRNQQRLVAAEPQVG